MALEIAHHHKPLRIDRHYSHTPRARALENQTFPADTQKSAIIWDYLLENGAPTARYVAGMNRQGAFPQSRVRDPRQPYKQSETIVGSKKLTWSPLSADVHIIGAVTGPYIAGEEDWHGMLLVTKGRRQVPTFGDLKIREMQGLHKTIAQSLHFLQKEKPNNVNVVGFSFSPFEHKRTITINHPQLGQIDVLHPRSPVQNLASIHGHVLSMDQTNLRPQPVSSPDKFDPRLTREPFLPQLVELMRELVIKPVAEKFPDLPMQSFEHKGYAPMYPKGLFVSLSPDDFVRPACAEFIRNVHQQYQKIYWEIAGCIGDTQHMQQGKITMYPVDEARERIAGLLKTPKYEVLSKNTKRFLRMFAEMQEPDTMITPTMNPKERASIMEKFVILGPAYNQLYYQQQGSIVIGWHPRFITGASPCETIGVHKDQQTVSPEEFQPTLDRQKAIGRRLADTLATKTHIRRQHNH